MTDVVIGQSTVDRTRIRQWLQDYGVYVAIAVILVYNVAFTAHFFTWDNLRTQLVQVVPVVIVALGMALVIGTEGVDLSVGSVMSMSAALIALYLGYGAVPAIVVAVVGGLLIGLVNGALVGFVGVQPIVATLALYVGVRGLAVAFTGGQFTSIANPDLLALGTASIAGLPVLVLIAAVLTAVVALVVRYTTFGRHLLAIGGNRRASELAGLPVRRTLVTVYVVCGGLAAVAGVLATARLTASVPSTQGLLMELSAITAVVVGGTPLSGGRVRVLGTVAGALLMQVLRASLIKHNLPDSTAQMVQALIILVAVYAARERGTR